MIWSAFLVGMLGSLHCAGMCGPLALAVPAAPGRKAQSVALYHLGRIFTYALLGVMMGLIGTTIRFGGFQAGLSIVTGLVVLALVAFPRMGHALGDRLMPVYKTKLITKFRTLMHTQHPGAPLGFGVLNGLLPCGLIWVALAGALETGYVETAALYMVLFGLGTVPLVTAPLLSGLFFSRFRQWQPARLVAAFTWLLGLLLITRGVLYLLPDDHHQSATVRVLQTITMCHGL